MEYIIAILVASIGFLGTAITIYFNNKSKDKERSLDLKKSIYLEACSELAKASQYIFALTDVGKNYPNFDIKTSGSFNKIHLIADISLLATTIKLTSTIFDAIAELVTMRLAIETKMNRMEFCIEEHDKNLQYFQAHTSMYQECNIPKIINDISQKQDTLLQKMKKLLEEHEVLNEETFKEKIDLLKCALKYNLLISPLLSEAIVKMRNELGINFTLKEESEYKVMINQSFEEANKKLEYFIKSLENELLKI